MSTLATSSESINKDGSDRGKFVPKNRKLHIPLNHIIFL